MEWEIVRIASEAHAKKTLRFGETPSYAQLLGYWRRLAGRIRSAALEPSRAKAQNPLADVRREATW